MPNYLLKLLEIGNEIGQGLGRTFRVEPLHVTSDSNPEEAAQDWEKLKTQGGNTYLKLWYSNVPAEMHPDESHLGRVLGVNHFFLKEWPTNSGKWEITSRSTKAEVAIIKDPDAEERVRQLRAEIDQALGQEPEPSTSPEPAKTVPASATAELPPVPEPLEPEPVLQPTKITTPRIPSNSQALVPTSPGRGLIRLSASIRESVDAWREYQELTQAILDASDYQEIAGKRYKKKSAFRKYARFYNLADEIVEATRIDRPDGSFMWRFVVRVYPVSDPSNFRTAVAVCDSRERAFAHVEHDVYATAHTRAKNRAISDLIAAGEVSAEEMTS